MQNEILHVQNATENSVIHFYKSTAIIPQWHQNDDQNV